MDNVSFKKLFESFKNRNNDFYWREDLINKLYYNAKSTNNKSLKENFAVIMDKILESGYSPCFRENVSKFILIKASNNYIKSSLSYEDCASYSIKDLQKIINVFIKKIKNDPKTKSLLFNSADKLDYLIYYFNDIDYVIDKYIESFKSKKDSLICLLDFIKLELFI